MITESLAQTVAGNLAIETNRRRRRTNDTPCLNPTNRLGVFAVIGKNKFPPDGGGTAAAARQ